MHVSMQCIQDQSINRFAREHSCRFFLYAGITPSAQSCNPAILMSTAFREATTWSGGLEEDY